MLSRKWATNPLIQQTLRRPGGFSLRALVGITVATALLIAGLMTWHILRSSRHELAVFETLFLIVGWGSYVIMPLLLAMLAVILTRRTVTGRPFELTLLTPLTNTTIITALVYGTVHRLRHILLGLFVLLPGMVLAFFHRLILVYDHDLYWPEYWVVVGPTLGALGLAVGLWGFNLLGIALGVEMALLRQYPGAALLSAPLTVGAIMVSPFGVTGGIVYVFQDAVVSVGCIVGYLVVLLLVILRLPYALLGHGIEHTARHWSRQQRVE